MIIFEVKCLWNFILFLENSKGSPRLFINIKDNKEPVFVVDTKTYNYDSNTIITVYDNKIYKVIKQENKDKNIIYSLKLWFMDDVEVSN